MSERLVLLRLGDSTAGSAGSIPVVLQISTEETRLVELTGQLPWPIALLALYDDWRKLYQSLGLPSRLEVSQDQPANSNQRDRCIELGRQVNVALNAWLESSDFQRVYQKILEQLSPTDRVRLLLQIVDPVLRRLPWHQWNLLERYPRAELALAMAEYHKGSVVAAEPGAALRVLAVLGDRRGIDVSVDAAVLRELLPGATIEFLVEPDLERLHGTLWQPWDILFFAGHSTSQADLTQGWLSIGPDRRLSLDQLRFGLKRSIDKGLRLAIFNSCDGLGLAQALMDLPIPQVVVMREEVPDPVAQRFLTYFLGALAGGKPVDLAVREGRERLQGLDDHFPGAAWLPILCQNPAQPSWSLPQGEKSSSLNAVHSVPASLIPASAIPASAIPANSIPASSIPANSIPANSIPANSISTRPLVEPVETKIDPAPRLSEPPKRLRRVLTATLTAGLAATLATIATIGLRATGWLEPLELLGFDSLIQYQPAETPDRRILIIGIDDADLNRQGQGGSLSDANLMRLLDRLDQAPPRIIGLDIYRPIAADPKVKGLRQRLGNQANLIFVCKTNDAEVVGLGPPPEVPSDLQSAQVGFSDFIADRDGVLRRQILFQTPSVASQCKTPYSFSTQLAAHYLFQENSIIGFTPQNDLQFVPGPGPRKTLPMAFPRLASRNGGYQGIESGGGQILIHYRQAAFDQVSLSQILSGQVSPDAFRDRVVLIGVTAQSASDRWVTPFGRSQPDQRPGVLVQAHMTSQLLSAVLDRRGLLQPSFWGYDGLWLWGWAFGAGLSRFLGVRWRGLGLVGVALGLSLGCAEAFGLGLWLPWVPGLIAILVARGLANGLGARADRSIFVAVKPDRG
jgi:CHASE2 domain-containing sensor protein